MTTMTRQCANDKCQIPFVPTHGLQKYCTPKCAKQAQNSRRYQSHCADYQARNNKRRQRPEVKAHVSAYYKKWYAANKHRINAKRRKGGGQ